MTHPPGLYESLLTRRLEVALEDIRARGWRDAVEGLDAAEAPAALARFVHDLLQPLLGSFGGEKAERLAQQVELVNAVVELLRSHLSDSPALEPPSAAEDPGGMGRFIPSEAWRSRLGSPRGPVVL